MRVWVLAGVLVVAGCQARTYPEDPRIAAAMDDAKCTNYGFQPRTPQFAQCMMQLDANRGAADAAAAARRAQALDGLANGLTAFGAGMQRQQPAYQPPVQTRCVRTGAYTNCMSY